MGKSNRERDFKVTFDVTAILPKKYKAWVGAIGAVLAVEQAGIEVTFVTTLLQIAVAVGGLGLALAFALGFHAILRNMAARHYYRPLVRIGDVVKVGDDEGTVVQFGATAMVLRTGEGDRIVPCARFLRQTVLVRSSSDTPPRT